MSDFNLDNGPSAVAIAAAIRDRKILSREVTEHALSRLEPVHAACNAIISRQDEEARQAADQADAALADKQAVGPLHGVALAHKDMFDRTGKIASWGGNIRADAPAAANATVIERLQSAGTHQIAALHLTEFAFGPTGHNYILGHARNPYDPSRITGGSSSGSAVCVATGAIPAALGSDTAGSLRLPAAACGIKSLKGTWTRVSRAGCMPLSGALDCVGPIARHVEDLAEMFAIIAGQDPCDGLTSARAVPDVRAALTAPTTGLKIAIDDALVETADSEVQIRLQSVADILATDIGVPFHPGRCSNWDEIGQLTQLLQFPEVASAHGKFMRERPGDYGPQVRARIEYGHFVSGVDHQTALRARGMILQTFLDEVFGDADALILPVYATELPTIDELDLGGGPKLIAAIARVIHFTRAINYLGLPSVTLPYPRSEGQLPNGFQLVGRPFGEAPLLTLAAAYERIVPPELAPVPH